LAISAGQIDTANWVTFLLPLPDRSVGYSAPQPFKTRSRALSAMADMINSKALHWTSDALCPVDDVL
jgi:hypothetical protein